MKTIAIIGCGKAAEGKEGWAIGHAHAHGYLHCGQEVKLLGVDLSPENLQAFGKAFDLPADQLFASTDALYAACTPDGVSICTWPALHHPMVMEAIDKGVKGIACEKPFASDTRQIREIERKAAEIGTKIVIAHQRRCNVYADAFKQVIDDKLLGGNLQAIGQVGDGWDILSWTTHWFDLANYLFDGPPHSILAGMDIRNTRRYQHAVEDASLIHADYGDRGSALFLTGPGTGASFSLHGGEGVARVGETGIELATFSGSRVLPFPDQKRDGFAAMLGELLCWMDGGPEARCAIGRSAVATEMAYAAQESARTGKTVSLPLENALFAPLEVAQKPVRSALWGKHILLYADSHYESGGREGIADAFGNMTGETVRVVDAETGGLHPDDLDSMDAIMIYHTQKEVDKTTCDLLESWVAEGRPLMITHAGLGAWPDWDTYQFWCCHVWEWGVSYHPHEPSVLKVPEGDPLDFGWQSAWLPRDEVFVALKEKAPVELGLTTTISTGEFPAAWCSKAHPNVGVWMPGHRKDSWKVPAMREGAARTLLHLFQDRVAVTNIPM
ncbi:MAG: Gfo/Idh/MocA family oxidoreductase [Kiritimatiellia bacterium]